MCDFNHLNIENQCSSRQDSLGVSLQPAGCALELSRVPAEQLVDCQARVVRLLASHLWQILFLFSSVAVNLGLQQHSTSAHLGRVAAGILRWSLAARAIKVSPAATPHIFTGQGFLLVEKNGFCRTCSKLVTVAFAPMSIVTQGLPALSGKSRVTSGGETCWSLVELHWSLNQLALHLCTQLGLTEHQPSFPVKQRFLW